MKKFLNRGRKSSDQPEEDTPSRVESDDTESVDDLHPIFNSGSSQNHQLGPSFNFNSDPNLNLNPSISNANPTPSFISKDSEAMDKSIFSHGKASFSTNQSSFASSGFSRKKRSQPQQYQNVDFGQPLHILDIPEETKDDAVPEDSVKEKLHQVCEDISLVLNQYSNSSINLTTTVINTVECLKLFVTLADSLMPMTWNFTTYNNGDLRKIMKIYLNMYDNMLQDDVYIKLKLLLVRNFNDFASRLNSLYQNQSLNAQSLIKPQNFAIGANAPEVLPNEDTLTKIMAKIAATSSVSIKEQNGSFIAPILRGIGKDLNILCLYFGYPNPNDYHFNLTKTLHELYDDIHVMVMKNSIELASAATHPNVPLTSTSVPDAPRMPVQRFKLPFRNPVEPTEPPMSLSLSIESSVRISGTMGGFIYPKIDLEKQPHLLSYAHSKFAISCGHVCLDKRDGNVEYPHVSAPSSVLINLYKQALGTQYQKFASVEDSNTMEAQAAYGSALHQIDEVFPPRKVKVYDSKLKQERYESRNFPIHRFGQIIWGERTLINARKNKDGSELLEKRLSDLAIIKVNKALKCTSNFLGDDISFNEYDPALMFDNLYVRKVIQLRRRAKEFSMDSVNDVDSSVSSFSSDELSSHRSLPVFKYGSTTKFTQGHLNGIKLVYWLDGAIHSSEFVVNSVERNSAFAAGGDSGSWILSKLEDVADSSNTKGLGVLGMMHSYDGEFKQFGLFTPMTEILQRLEEVTNIKWGVVGVTEKHDDDASSMASDVSEDLVSDGEID